MTVQTITENGDTFQICNRCTDWVGTCTCPTDGTPVDRADVSRNWEPLPAWQDWRGQYATRCRCHDEERAYCPDQERTVLADILAWTPREDETNE